MAYRQRFTHSEWRTLEFAPLWVFTIVAAVDGHVDRKEVEALAEEIAEAQLYRNVLAREVFTSVGDNFAEVWPAYQRDTRSALDGLHEVDVLLNQKVEHDEANGFRIAVLALGTQIIKKGSKTWYGSRDTKKEKAAWILAAIALGLRPEGLNPE